MSGTLRARIVKAAEGVETELDSVQAGLLESYLELLALWNRTINLTALPLDGFPQPSLERLLVEPLLAARFFPSTPLAWYDVGSGGGSPAIPLKIIRPLARLAMVESKSRKAAFLREAIHRLQLPGAEVVEARFESLAQTRQDSGDLITVRAVKRDMGLRRAAAAVLRPGGRLLAFGTRGGSEIGWPGFEILERCELPGSGNGLGIFVREPQR